MKYPVPSFLLLFLAGFLTGNFANYLGFGFVAPQEPAAETAHDGQESARLALTETAKPCECNEGAAITAARRSSRGSTKVVEETPDRGLPPLLPPHVADPYFFGPEIDDPDVLWQREEAVKEFIASLDGSGLPAEEIAALTEAAEDELAAMANPEPDTAIYEGDLLTPPSPEEQAEDFALSLRQSGQTEEVVEQLVDDFWAGQTMEPMESFEDIDLPDPHNPEQLLR